jgi:hypothetical protein
VGFDFGFDFDFLGLRTSRGEQQNERNDKPADHAGYPGLRRL